MKKVFIIIERLTNRFRTYDLTIYQRMILKEAFGIIKAQEYSVQINTNLISENIKRSGLIGV